MTAFYKANFALDAALLSGVTLGMFTYLANALRTGIASSPTVAFARDEEPREFWALALSAAVALAVGLWLDLAALGDLLRT